jgi:hypothetical protein
VTGKEFAMISLLLLEDVESYEMTAAGSRRLAA